MISPVFICGFVWMDREYAPYCFESQGVTLEQEVCWMTPIKIKLMGLTR